MTRRTGDKTLVEALLLVTVSTGMLDAISLLHLKTFTGYMTGTVILIGIHLAGAADLAGPGLVALCAFFLGAVAGGRLVRRRHAPPRLVGEVLLGVSALITAVSLFAVLVPTSATGPIVIFVLAIAMGLQTSATRHAGLADMSMPAATMILHGLAHDSRLAGGRADRIWRRLGILGCLLAGAASGAVLSRSHLCLSLLVAACCVAVAGLMLTLSRAVRS